MAGPNPNFYLWGLHLPEHPAQIMDDALLALVEQDKPLVILDPFRYGHAAKENDSDEMAVIMQRLRRIATAGAGVIVVHHATKIDKNIGRGSSAIQGGVDLEISQERGEDGLITIGCTAPRYVGAWKISARQDPDSLELSVIESPELRQHQDDINRIEQAIRENPGATQNRLIEAAKMGKARAIRLLKEGGNWTVVQVGQGRTYFPLPTGSTGSGTSSATPGTSSAVLSLFKREPRNQLARTDNDEFINTPKSPLEVIDKMMATLADLEVTGAFLSAHGTDGLTQQRRVVLNRVLELQSLLSRKPN
jgi:hypothetical protein